MLSCSCAVVRDEARHFGSSEKSESFQNHKAHHSDQKRKEGEKVKEDIKRFIITISNMMHLPI